MVASPVRVGLVGANVERNGWAIRAHAPVIAALPSFTLHSVATRSASTAKAAAGALRAERWYDSAVALTEDPDVDLVVVGVNVRDHADVVTAARATGKHILCEWPLGLDSAQSDVLAATRGGGLEVIGLQGRESPAVRYALELLEEGYVGRLLDVSVRIADATLGNASLGASSAYTADRLGGVTVLSVPGCHILDVAMRLGGTLDAVAARLTTLTSEVVIENTGQIVARSSDDHVALHGITRSGALLVAHLASGSPSGTGASVELRGDAGALRIETSGPGQFQVSSLNLTGIRGAGPLRPIPLPKRVIEHVPSVVRGGPGENLAGVYARIAGALAGRAPHPADFAHAARLHRLVAAAVTSSAAGGRETPIAD
ncbi:MAG: Gfo/Idh/MocA family oxidoreductase [Mycetocola sp.]